VQHFAAPLTAKTTFYMIRNSAGTLSGILSYVAKCLMNGCQHVAADSVFGELRCMGSEIELGRPINIPGKQRKAEK
jgi:hypothetical protein